MRSWPLLVILLAAAPARAATPLRIILADPDNLQDMTFWVARGAGLFEREGLDLTLSIPSSPGGVNQLVLQNDAPVAILPPPVYLDLIAARTPIRVVANLLQNDPINLVVRRQVAEARGLDAAMSLGDRLRGLRGLKVAVAPGPVGRLRALFASQGLVADQHIQIVTVAGPGQNEALAQGRVDALYAHTPYLEQALLDQDAILLVNQSAGEVPGLGARQIHSLCVAESFAKEHPLEVTALVRALAQAERLVHTDHAATVEAILHALPRRDRRQVERIVTIYEPAIPPTPEVSVAGLRAALAFFPASRTPPDLSGIDLEQYIDNRFARAAADPAKPWWPAAGAIVLIVVAVLLAWRRSVSIRRDRAPQSGVSRG